MLGSRPTVIEPAAADKIYAIATSAGGTNVGIALGRFDYLMLSDRLDEAERVLDGIRDHASMQSGYWLARAVLGMARGEDVTGYAREGLRWVDPSSPHRAVLEELAT